MRIIGVSNFLRGAREDRVLRGCASSLAKISLSAVIGAGVYFALDYIISKPSSEDVEEIIMKHDVSKRFENYADLKGNNDGFASIDEQRAFINYGREQVESKLIDVDSESQIPFFLKEDAVRRYEEDSKLITK